MTPPYILVTLCHTVMSTQLANQLKPDGSDFLQRGSVTIKSRLNLRPQMMAAESSSHSCEDFQPGPQASFHPQQIILHHLLSVPLLSWTAHLKNYYRSVFKRR